jgi:hypothetical protein
LIPSSTSGHRNIANKKDTSEEKLTMVYPFDSATTTPIISQTRVPNETPFVTVAPFRRQVFGPRAVTSIARRQHGRDKDVDPPPDLDTWGGSR